MNFRLEQWTEIVKFCELNNELVQVESELTEQTRCCFLMPCSACAWGRDENRARQRHLSLRSGCVEIPKPLLTSVERLLRQMFTPIGKSKIIVLFLSIFFQGVFHLIHTTPKNASFYFFFSSLLLPSVCGDGVLNQCFQLGFCKTGQIFRSLDGLRLTFKACSTY